MKKCVKKCVKEMGMEGKKGGRCIDDMRMKYEKYKSTGVRACCHSVSVYVDAVLVSVCFCIEKNEHE